MKTLLLFLILFSAFTFYGQTHTRKTRSDKGKKHSHTASYNVKKALKPKPTKPTKTTKKK